MKVNGYLKIGVLLMSLAVVTNSHADWKDWLKGLSDGDAPAARATSTTSSGLSQSDMVSGLKQALQQGSKYAVSSLGRQDGFLGNARVKIPMPGNLARVEKVLRDIGMSRYADEFVSTMNRAAEKAVVEAGPIVVKAIQNMSIEDAVKILRGNDTAATDYFRQHTSDSLQQKMLPITKEMTAQTGVTSAYKNMVNKMGFAKNLVGHEAGDLDQYVTGKTLDGLFLMIADEEKKIRQNPVARTTDLLKKVFSSVK